MVQNKQKSNKINITATITCFMFIMVFVFGCVQFAHAYTFDEVFDKYDGDKSYYMAYSHGNDSEYFFIDEFSSECVCYYQRVNDSCSYLGIFSKKKFTYVQFVGDNKTIKEGIYHSDTDLYSNSFVFGGNVSGFKSSILAFSNYADVKTYFDTGQVNNPIYQPKENIEFDSDIEVPLNLDIRLNGNSDFVPNVKISCNQTEQIENRYLEVQYSIGYKATWKLLGGIGLNVKSKTSPTVYGSIEQLEDSFDNGGTSFETILSLSKLSHSVAPDEEAFSKYEPTPNVYWSLKEIKNDNSEMKIWCRNRVGNKASKWIMVSGDGYKANFDVVDSDENGNPTDMKDDTANSETGYGSDYWNNRDNTPQEDYFSTDVKNNLKDLKNNYSSLANFFKELFGFLPAEIWIILIGLVATMALIAILIFVRG